MVLKPSTFHVLPLLKRVNVIHLHHHWAFLLYSGTDRLKEWIPLKGEGDVPSRLRVAGPIIAPVKYEGTRKRRRAAMGNCMLWSVGDQVDVWMHGGYARCINMFFFLLGNGVDLWYISLFHVFILAMWDDILNSIFYILIFNLNYICSCFT